PVVSGTQLRRASHELADLASFGPKPPFVGQYEQLAAQKVADEIDDGRDGDVYTGADVEHLARVGSTRAELNECLHSVSDVNEVPARSRRSDRNGSSAQCLRHDRGYDRALRLPWSERVEGTCNHDRETKGKTKRLGKLVGAHLARGIRRLRVERMCFIDGRVLRRPVDLA